MNISVLIPIYNKEQHIERSLSSLVNQTYQEGIECIIVDDGSSDNSLKVTEDFLNQYNGKINFTLIKEKKNKGVAVARNTLIEQSKGDYILFLDADDELPLNSIQLLVEEANRHPQIDMVLGFMYTKEYTEGYDISMYNKHQYVTDNTWIQYHFLCTHHNIPINPVNKLIRRNLLIENKIHFLPGIIHEDLHWMYYVMQRINSLAFVFEPTYIRYYNEVSIMTSQATVLEVETAMHHKILVDYSKHLNNPLLRLKIYRFLERYFRMKLHRYNFKNDKKLIINFIFACIKARDYNSAKQLVKWLIYSLFNKQEGQEYWVKHWFTTKYIKESMSKKLLFPL